jgi:hypothetical protein
VLPTFGFISTPLEYCVPIVNVLGTFLIGSYSLMFDSHVVDIYTKHRGQVVNTPPSYSGGPGFNY